ncbi:hypothetical protein [Arcobacter sp. LA11]|uniref:hypothetical protein n=1 Tax=Arcobacter sp. LA11 TaxID=1898176 RepID=UPI000932C216|nr:hypothetical protein [Arcobacter sp. LA11]
MKKILLLALFSIFSFANENYINMKNCENIKLSQYTVLVSCHRIDYLIEYRNVDDEEKDTIKKITAVTTKDQRIIKSIGK